MTIKNFTAKKEFGDFQTPLELSRLMVDIIDTKNIFPDVVIEPTCGVGNILLTAHDYFNPRKTIGVEINGVYCGRLSEKINGHKNIMLINNDIFTSIESLKKEIGDEGACLFIGNPPWATNSDLSSAGSSNMPKKTNIKNLRGIEAITGKSNFDITEYIIVKLLEEFNNKKAVFAFLCKTSVARNILKYCWRKNIPYKEALLFPIDSKKYFGASVDACYLIIDATKKLLNNECRVFDSIERRNGGNIIGLCRNTMIVDMATFKSHDFLGKSDYVWRSGVKHDCAKVMEFNISGRSLVNGYGEIVDMEDDLLYPLLKSSDIANGKLDINRKILVTQKKIGEETKTIKFKYPKIWRYLNDHMSDFKKRKSAVYKNKPDFSIFSIGTHSFSPCKIAISAFYKNLDFKILGSFEGKPIMLDDTCNFIPCGNSAEADILFSLLTDEKTKIFLNSIIFWDAKRPITTEILNAVDLEKIARRNGLYPRYEENISPRDKLF